MSSFWSTGFLLCHGSTGAMSIKGHLKEFPSSFILITAQVFWNHYSHFLGGGHMHKHTYVHRDTYMHIHTHPDRHVQLHTDIYIYTSLSRLPLCGYMYTYTYSYSQFAITHTRTHTHSHITIFAIRYLSTRAHVVALLGAKNENTRKELS